LDIAVFDYSELISGRRFDLVDVKTLEFVVSANPFEQLRTHLSQKQEQIHLSFSPESDIRDRFFQERGRLLKI
jgi:hypothetical protein